MELRDHEVFVIGLGGLGAPAAKALCAAGVRRFALMDADVVDASNLHRQTLYTAADVGLSKVAVAKRHLEARGCEVRAFNARFSTETSHLLADASVVIEGTDNLPSKYVASREARLAQIPLVTAGALRWGGWALKGGTACKVSSNTLHDACLECLFGALPERPMESCEFAGVVGPAVGALGIMQAIFALEVLLDSASSPAGALFRLDGLGGTTRRTTLKAQAGCPALFESAPQGALPTLESEPQRMIGEVANAVENETLQVRMLDQQRGEVTVRGDYPSPDAVAKALRRERPGLATVCGPFVPGMDAQDRTCWVSHFELSRRSLFSRHELLAEFADGAQNRLLSATITTGSASDPLLRTAESTALDYLQRAGVTKAPDGQSLDELLNPVLTARPKSAHAALDVAYAHLAGALVALESIRRLIGLPPRNSAPLPQDPLATHPLVRAEASPSLDP